MAQRRMFSQQIVDSDAFLDMPQSTQALYFHLGMRADDDGFVGNPKKIIRMIGAAEDDFKVLLGKRFILAFESGVIVIKHWKIHNYIQNDRYHETKYLTEKALIEVKENGSYTERIKDVSKVDTEVRLGKVRQGKASLGESEDTLTQKTEIFLQEIQDFLQGQTLSALQESEMKKFASYWTEPNASKKKLRFELEKTWDLPRRIARWMNNTKFEVKNKVTKV